MNSLHRKYMSLAIDEAKNASSSGDVPVGAIIVKDDIILSKANNSVELELNPINHAEIIAIISASQMIGKKHLTGCDLYVTLEPCTMCVGAIILARIRRVIFGAYDPKTGACGSLFSIPFEKKLNHQVEVIGGIMEEECSQLLSRFFANIRDNNDA